MMKNFEFLTLSPLNGKFYLMFFFFENFPSQCYLSAMTMVSMLFLVANRFLVPSLSYHERYFYLKATASHYDVSVTPPAPVVSVRLHLYNYNHNKNTWHKTNKWKHFHSSAISYSTWHLPSDQDIYTVYSKLCSCLIIGFTWRAYCLQNLIERIQFPDSSLTGAGSGVRSLTVEGKYKFDFSIF